MERLVKSVVRDLLEALTRDGFGRGCKDYTDSCKEYLETYGDTNADCGHKCEYCSKFKWAVDRAKHYEEKLGIPWKEVLKSWEDDRSYWFLNYYQDCNQPLIESDNVFVFENAKAFGKIPDVADISGYESPIKMYVSQMVKQVEEARENEILHTIREEYAIDVDKEELIKALNYDREQYNQGYQIGYRVGYEKAKADLIKFISDKF